MASQQYRAWSDCMDLQAGLVLVWWQRLITFGFSRIRVKLHQQCKGHKATNVYAKLGGNFSLSQRGNSFQSQFCVPPTYEAQEYQTCTDTALSGYQIKPWSRGVLKIHFLRPEKLTLGQCRIRTTSQSAV